MGSAPSEPRRAVYGEPLTEVEYTHDLLVGQHEVTQAEWVALGFENEAGTTDNGEGGVDCVEARCPASTLTWYQAVEYTNRLSDRAGLPRCLDLPPAARCHGAPGDPEYVCDQGQPTSTPYTSCLGYRLPTLGEFEYAARAGVTTVLPDGGYPREQESSQECFDVPHLSEVAWYCANSGNHTHPVGTRKANAWGLFDMLGNATEYSAEGGVFNGYGPPSSSVPHVIEPGFDVGARSPTTSRTMRGGIYFGLPAYQRLPNPGVSGRFDEGGAGGGFRVVRTVPREVAAGW